ncbi:RNA-directed DNA polymerase (Reverse transcriptase), partial [Trifolium medium]|nr:RNA-directed DNA polymerase (Reverse transcriptase) [Trifolium medium]
MGVRHVLGTGNYLGLPSMIGRKKKDVFAYLKDRIWKRINSWRGRALSRAGKEVMIKSVLQAISSYVMSIYLLPDSTIKDIERMTNSFWWGGGANNKGIRWLAWDRMTHPKDQGGMGFRDFRSFNLAMLAKQGWNIMTKPHTLMAKLFKARWSVGNGTSIKVMTDPWLRDTNGAWFPSPQVQGVHNFTVNELLIPNMKVWDKAKIESIFPLHVAKSILEIPLFDMNEDKLLWIDSTNGQYSVKSGYKLLLNVTGTTDDVTQQEDWHSLWKILAPPKAKHLLWRICKGCLPTRMRLQERHVFCPLSCPLCDQASEDDWHLLFACATSSQALQTA